MIKYYLIEERIEKVTNRTTMETHTKTHREVIDVWFDRDAAVKAAKERAEWTRHSYVVARAETVAKVIVTTEVA